MKLSEVDNFRHNLDVALKETGWSIAKLSRDTGMGQPYLSRVRSGTVTTGYGKPINPGLENSERIASSLGFFLREMLLPPEVFRDVMLTRLSQQAALVEAGKSGTKKKRR